MNRSAATTAGANAADRRFARQAPVVIGGLGGSGTRVVAEILMSLGWFMGEDLNESSDNLLFTYLFKRPRWYRRVRRDPQAIAGVLRLFDRVASGDRPGVRSWPVIGAAFVESVRFGHDHVRARCAGFSEWKSARWQWSVDRAGHILQPRRQRHGRWGWKEPNAHVYLQDLARYYPGMRYVHVMRHGLDMAFSGNQAQLYNWGWLFGLDVPEPVSERQLAVAALDYWIAANRRAMEVGSSLLGGRFLTLNYEALCADPGPTVRRLCGFLGADCGDERVERAARIPRRPATQGRYQHRDLSIFRADQIDAVRAAGFAV